MKTTSISAIFTFAMIASIGSQASAAGPISKLYITNYGEFSGGNVTGLDIVQGAGVTSVATAYQLGIDIAVYGDVRTMGYSTNDQGTRYDLAANPLVGGPYTNTIPNSQLHDGTSDGNFNYSVDYTTGDVLQFDRNWANPVALFNASANVPGAGWITINVNDGSFWISQWGGPDVVGHYTHTGTFLGSFNSGIFGSVGLALDPADGTLWMGNANFVLHQYSQAGAFLQMTPYTLQGAWYGMEFDTGTVPEPTTVVLTAIAFATLTATGRRHRSVNK